MDEELKQKIFVTTIIISLLVLIVSLIGNYNLTKKINNQTIAMNRSPLHNFRFLEYKENKNGSFIDIVSLENGKKHENVFISKECPYGKTKQPGIIMKLSAVEYFNTYSKESSFLFDRAYDYICTNLNMEKEDEKLLLRIKEARERSLVITDLTNSSQQVKP